MKFKEYYMKSEFHELIYQMLARWVNTLAGK